MDLLQFNPDTYCQKLHTLRFGVMNSSKKLNDSLEVIDKENRIIWLLKIIVLPLCKLFGKDLFQHTRVHSVVEKLFSDFRQQVQNPEKKHQYYLIKLLNALNKRTHNKYSEMFGEKILAVQNLSISAQENTPSLSADSPAPPPLPVNNASASNRSVDVSSNPRVETVPETIHERTSANANNPSNEPSPQQQTPQQQTRRPLPQINRESEVSTHNEPSQSSSSGDSSRINSTPKPPAPPEPTNTEVTSPRTPKLSNSQQLHPSVNRPLTSIKEVQELNNFSRDKKVTNKGRVKKIVKPNETPEMNVSLRKTPAEQRAENRPKYEDPTFAELKNKIKPKKGIPDGESEETNDEYWSD